MIVHALSVVATVALIVCPLLDNLGSTPEEMATAQPVRQLQDVEVRLNNVVAASDHMTLDSIGDVEYEGFSAPVWLVSFTPTETPQHRVLFTGGIHGNEPAGTEALIRFVEDLGESPGLWPGIAFDIVPIVNPWGWVHDRRYNRQGRDLNRDFASFKGQESVIIRDFVRDRDYDLILDTHEDSGAQGFYLYQKSRGFRELSRKIIDTQRALGRPIEQDEWMVILKTRDGVIYVPLWTQIVVKLIRQLSLANYMKLTKCPRTFLFETPRRLSLQERVDMHRTGIDILLESLNP